jgi:hypothetical protein
MAIGAQIEDDLSRALNLLLERIAMSTV